MTEGAGDVEGSMQGMGLTYILHAVERAAIELQVARARYEAALMRLDNAAAALRHECPECGTPVPAPVYAGPRVLADVSERAVDTWTYTAPDGREWLQITSDRPVYCMACGDDV